MLAKPALVGALLGALLTLGPAAAGAAAGARRLRAARWTRRWPGIRWPWDFLRRRQAPAPTVCADSPAGWADAGGHTCQVYAASGYCTGAGGYGAGWQAVWGTFGAHAAQGRSAVQACCVCGGGARQVAASCNSFACPLGYVLKADSSLLYCASTACAAGDAAACCDADPEVLAVVERVETEASALAAEARTNITNAGAAHVASLASSASALGATLATAAAAEARSRRQEALAAAQRRFGDSTRGAEGVGPAARHQVTYSGYVAVRDAAASGDARVDGARLRAAADGVLYGFSSALQAWEGVRDVSGQARDLGLREFSRYHSDLNATWPTVLRGIAAVNTVAAASEVPGEAARWSKQAARLASDLAQMAHTQADSLELQVAAAEARARTAREATEANSGRIGRLEALVSRAAEATATAGHAAAVVR